VERQTKCILRLPHFTNSLSSLRSVYCVYRLVLLVLGYGWKCLDFDIFLEDRQSGLPAHLSKGSYTVVLKVHKPRRIS
jgi:hypothetical protein